MLFRLSSFYFAADKEKMWPFRCHLGYIFHHHCIGMLTGDEWNLRIGEMGIPVKKKGEGTSAVRFLIAKMDNEVTGVQLVCPHIPQNPSPCSWWLWIKPDLGLEPFQYAVQISSKKGRLLFILSQI